MPTLPNVSDVWTELLKRFTVNVSFVKPSEATIYMISFAFIFMVASVFKGFNFNEDVALKTYTGGEGGILASLLTTATSKSSREYQKGLTKP